MELHPSGRFTSELLIYSSVSLHYNIFGELLVGYILFLPSNANVKPPSCSTLSGNHGVPRVHYKGKQGDFYIMVMDHVLFILHIYGRTLPFLFQL